MKRGILFCGFRHSHIFSLYRRVAVCDRVEILACVEPDDAARAEAEATLGAVFSHESYETLLADPRVDTVAIGCAYGHRGEAVIRALEAGKHVLSDKPICTDLTQLETIRRLSEEKGLTVGCMLDLRDLPQTRAARAILQSGRLGRIRNVSFNGQHCLNYGSRPAWYFEPGLHGGTINDLAIHGIDLVRWLTGEEFDRVDAARVWNAYAHRHPHFKDSALFMARLTGGAGVLADVSYSTPKVPYTLPSYWEFRFWCEKGMLTFNYENSDVTVYEEGRDAPVKEAGIPEDKDYLTDFLDSHDRALTRSVLRSTETALKLQKIADREGAR